MTPALLTTIALVATFTALTAVAALAALALRVLLPRRLRGYAPVIRPRPLARLGNAEEV